MGTGFTPEKAQQRTAVFGHSTEPLLLPLQYSSRNDPHITSSALPLANRLGSPRKASVASAVTGPAPGCVISSRAPEGWPAWRPLILVTSSHHAAHAAQLIGPAAASMGLSPAPSFRPTAPQHITGTWFLRKRGTGKTSLPLLILTACPLACTLETRPTIWQPNRMLIVSHLLMILTTVARISPCRPSTGDQKQIHG